MKKIFERELRRLIRDGITTNELNSQYEYSDITDMSWLLSGCSELKTIPKMNTSNVKYMQRMFENCTNIEFIPKLDTSKAKYMIGIFNGCINLRELHIQDFSLYNFSRLNNKFLREKYPEYFI